MRVYHRLIHIRDQKERHEDIPNHITAHPVFKLTTDFRRHVQQKSAPISKTSPLIVDAEAMAIFGRLAAVLGEQGSVVMIYLVACILERLFGRETVEDIEAIRGDLTISDIIDGISTDAKANDREVDEMNEMEADVWEEVATEPQQVSALKPNGWSLSTFTSQPAPTAPPVAASAFAGLVSTPNVFGTSSIFGSSAFSNLNQPPTTSVFDTQPQAGLAGSTSISIVPTPVATINPTPLAIRGESDLINGMSTNTEVDDTEGNEMEEMEPDWQEDASELQQVSPPTPTKPSSNPGLSSTSPPLTSTTLVPPALPAAISTSAGLFSAPNVFDTSSIFQSSTFSGSNQPPTITVSSIQPQVGLAVSTAISIVSTPSVAAIKPTHSAVPEELTSISNVIDDVSTNTKVSNRGVDEVDATEAEDWQEDTTVPQQASPPTPLKPSSNGWFSSSFPSQPSTFTPPASTTLPSATSINAELASNPNVVGMLSISGNSAPSNLNQSSTTLVPDTQPQVDFCGLAASTSISTVASPPLVAINPTSFSNGSPQPLLPAPTTQQQPLANGKRQILTGIASGEVSSPPTQRKRARRRISSRYHPPRTDEELAKRFKEVHTCCLLFSHIQWT
jgi:nuclear mRNA export protein SAC3